MPTPLLIAQALECIPIVCEAFNANASKLDDPMAAFWNVTSRAGYEAVVNVTCKAGHRAVPRGHDTNVSCHLQSWYVMRCGMCGWARNMECQKVTCPLPSGAHVKPSSQHLGSRVQYGDNVSIECSTGYMPAVVGRDFSLDPLYPGNGTRCEGTSYEAVCSGDCIIEPRDSKWRIPGAGRSCKNLPGFVGNYGAANSCERLSQHPSPGYYCREAFDRNTNLTAAEACCVCGGGMSQQLVACQAA